MCGIVGAISSGPIDAGVLDRMRDDLAHRGPDHSASWLSSDGKVGLGHRRLAIIDPLPEADQPFASHDGRFLLVYNGELYNYRELKKELETHGVRFRTASDSEVLLEAFRIRRGKQGFLAPVNRWLQDPNGAVWTRCAGSVLSDLLGPSLLPGLRQDLRDGSRAGPLAALPLLLLDHWLARWQPAG